jgi:drug/metabolite transporter (DMT)-like permease
VSQPKNNAVIAGSLLFTIFLWGGNNAGTKWLVMSWPPVFTGSIRFLCAGILLLAVLRFTKFLGAFQPLTPELRRRLWLRGGLSLAVYIVAFNWALRFTTASHVALYLGASPVWALLWEEKPRRTWASALRYGPALLALAGVVVLFWPALQTFNLSLLGEILGLVASVLWTTFSRQVHDLSAHLAETEIAAHTMWMAGVWLLPVGLIEVALRGFSVNAAQAGVLAFCIVFGGVVPYALWNSALRHWRTSQVMLFGNLIPLSTGLWVYCFLGEPLTHTFWAAMALIVAGVLLGQAGWAKIFGLPESF